jgi:RNA polymerase sigma factor (sigma-70 family)
MYRPAFIELSENHVEPARRPPEFVQRDAIDTILGRGFPERQRHILMRLFVDGADNAQIGVELGISANAVSQQRMYAIQRLKARYLRANNRA